MATQWREQNWETLLVRIRNQKCTPFLGAGIAAELLPTGSGLAREWATERNYPLIHSELIAERCPIKVCPLEASYDLSRVAQFLAVDGGDRLVPKEKVQERLQGVAPPDFSKNGDPHGVLAELPFSVFITTNYDDFMFEALKAKKKKPRQEFCRWNDDLKTEQFPSVFDEDSEYVLSAEEPLVYHLHGQLNVAESLVLTEDDYLDFLLRIPDPKLLPPRIVGALASESLLFIGYSLSDWDFRVLYRTLREQGGGKKRLSLSVQMRPESENAENIIKYLEDYFNWMQIIVYWKSAEEFCEELLDRWKRFSR